MVPLLLKTAPQTIKYIKLTYEPAGGNARSHKHLHTNVHSSIIHGSQKAETTQTSPHWWMDKQNAVYPYNEVLLNHKREWSTDIRHGTQEPWESYD